MKITVFGLLLLGCCLHGGQTDGPTSFTPCSKSYDQAVMLGQLIVKMQNLEKENEAQAVKLRELEKQSARVNTQLQVKQVAFSASLVAYGYVNLGPYSRHITLVFRYVPTNIGNAYNRHTGVFTAPVRGVYHFEFYIGARRYCSGAVLLKNGYPIFATYQSLNFGFGSSSNGVSLLLNVGDVVFLRLSRYARINDSRNHYSTFSGHLLFTM